MTKSTARSSRLGTAEMLAARERKNAIDGDELRLITKAELRRIVPYTPQHILRLEKRGLFPRRIPVGANRVAWLLSEVEQWVAARLAERDANLQ